MRGVVFYRNPARRGPTYVTAAVLLALFLCVAACGLCLAAQGNGPQARRMAETGNRSGRTAPGTVAGTAAQTGEAPVFTARREFRGPVRRDMAERVAKTAASLAGYDQAARILAKEPDVHFAAGGGAGDGVSLDGLARLAFEQRLVSVGAEGFPPFLSAVAGVALERPAAFRERLIKALADEERLELYGQILARQRELVARYDALAPYLLSLPGLAEGGREQFLGLQAIANELAGLEQYAALLDDGGVRPDDAAGARERLERAEKLAPNNPLILNGLAEMFLRLDRPLVALDYAGKAIVEAPGFARAHDTRGAILLRQRLPLMAAQSFGKAIALSPRNAAYYMNRASAYLVLEEIEAMCGDFQRACALGDCEGLMWATGEYRCGKGGE